jgi:phenylacetate-CoA ligase
VNRGLELLVRRKVSELVDLDPESSNNYVRGRFVDLLLHARATTAWYRQELYPEFDEEELYAFLKKLPVVTKNDLRSHNSDFFSSKPGLMPMEHRTSGSTGIPITLRASLAQRTLSKALYQRWLRDAGVNQGRQLILSGFLTPGPDDSDVYWYDRVNRRIFLSIHRLNEETLSRAASTLRGFRPTVIHGYPTAIAQLAELWPSVIGDLPARPSVVATAEVLTPLARHRIESTFGRVLNVYGSQENCHLAMECRFGRMHLNPYIGVVELLDANDRPVPAGSLGRVVATGLNHRAMPLIRYDLGDMAAMSDEGPCPCGVWWPYMKAIEGRADDLVRTHDGRLIPMIGSGIIRSVDGVRQMQIVQHPDLSITIRLSPEPSVEVPSVALESALRQSLHAKLGVDHDISFEYVEDLNRGARGKLKAVIVETAPDS